MDKELPLLRCSKRVYLVSQTDNYKTKKIKLMNDYCLILLGQAKAIGDKLLFVATNLVGQLLAMIALISTFMVTWLGDTRYICTLLVAGAMLLDLAWGIASNVKRGTFVLSGGLKKTGVKLAIYITILLTAYLFESAIDKDWTFVFRMAATLLIVAEAISIVGHILIIKPNFPILKLLGKALSSEIAKKLGVERQDIEDLYNQINASKK